eukprot:scaffold285815_cov33-Tisochrysis_lutea.AAC.2
MESWANSLRHSLHIFAQRTLGNEGVVRTIVLEYGRPLLAQHQVIAVALLKPLPIPSIGGPLRTIACQHHRSLCVPRCRVRRVGYGHDARDQAGPKVWQIRRHFHCPPAAELVIVEFVEEFIFRRSNRSVSTQPCEPGRELLHIQFAVVHPKADGGHSNRFGASRIRVHDRRLGRRPFADARQHEQRPQHRRRKASCPSAIDPNHLHFEHQIGSGRYRAGSQLAVTELCRDMYPRHIPEPKLPSTILHARHHLACTNLEAQGLST